MKRASEVDDLPSSIDSAATDPSKWIDVVKAMYNALPGAKVILQIVDQKSNLVSTPLSYGISANTMINYNDYYQYKNPLMARSKEIPIGVIKNIDETIKRADFERTEFYNDLVRPEKSGDAATFLKFGDHKGRYASITAHYDVKRMYEMDDRVRLKLNPLINKMRAALEINRYATPRFEENIPRGFTENFNDPAIIADHAGTLHALNAGAEFLLKERFCSLDRNGRIVLSNPIAQHALAALIFQVCHEQDGSPAFSNDMIVRERAGDFKISAIPVSARTAGVAPAGILALYGQPRVALLIIRTIPRRDPLTEARDLVRCRYGLTKAEVAILAAFDQGGTLADIADRLGVTRSTVHTHMKSIFLKTGISRQRDLMMMIMQARLESSEPLIHNSGR